MFIGNLFLRWADSPVVFPPSLPPEEVKFDFEEAAVENLGGWEDALALAVLESGLVEALGTLAA